MFQTINIIHNYFDTSSHTGVGESRGNWEPGSQEIIRSHRKKKNSSCDRKNTVNTHRIEYPLQEEEQILLQEVHLVLQETNNYFVSQEKYLIPDRKYSSCHVMHTALLVIGTFPVSL